MLAVGLLRESASGLGTLVRGWDADWSLTKDGVQSQCCGQPPLGTPFPPCMTPTPLQLGLQALCACFP